jgi:predicted Zn-dependent protease
MLHLRDVRTWVLAALIAPLALMTGCKVNPATGQRQFDFLSQDQEVALGLEAAPELIRGYGGEVSDAWLTDYVSTIGQDLAQYVEKEYRDLPWEFTLLDSDVINAFALPGGQVFISRGLMMEMTNEAQLAGVLGHEIGHVTAEHGDQQVVRQMGLQGLAVTAAVVAQLSDEELVQYGAPALVTGAGIVNLKYGRDEELEADALGLRYMTKAGYDPAGQLQVMEILARASEGAGQPPEFLSTHPHPETRINRIRKLLRTDYAFTQGTANYTLGQTTFREQVVPRLDRYSRAAPERELTPGERAIVAASASGERSCWCSGCSSGG